jgi:hypothetical protein
MLIDDVVPSHYANSSAEILMWPSESSAGTLIPLCTGMVVSGARAPLSGANIIGNVHCNCGISVCEILPTPWDCEWRVARKTCRETIHSLDESTLSNHNLRVSYLEILQLLVSNVPYCKHFVLFHVAQLLHVGDNLLTLRLCNFNHFCL